MHLLRLDVAIFQPQFIAIIQRRRAAQRQQHHPRQPRLRLPTKAARQPNAVMVAQHIVRPGKIRQHPFHCVHQSLHRFGRPFALIHQPKIKRQVQLLSLLTIIFHPAIQRPKQFANRYPPLVFIKKLPDFLHHLVNLILIHVVDLLQAVKDGVFGQVGRSVEVGWIVAQLFVFDNEANDIHAEPVHAAIQPKAQGVKHGSFYVRVAPVEFRLLWHKLMQVILPGRFIPRPRRAAKKAAPVVGQRAVGLGIAPDVPIPLGVVAAAARFNKPRVLVGSVVGNPVNDDLDAAGVGGFYKAVKGCQVAKHRVNIAIVGHIVAKIFHRRRVERANPDGINAKGVGGTIIQIIKSLNDAF